MNVDQITTRGKKLTITKDGKEIARVYLYFIRNELHEKPYALMEDLFVQEEFRGQGFGKQMVKAAIEEAKKEGCYKVICTSRYEREQVHQMYQDLGFKIYAISILNSLP